MSTQVPRTKISIAKPVLDEEMKEATLYALQNERFVLGESVLKFEEEFARYCGTDFAISTATTQPDLESTPECFRTWVLRGVATPDGVNYEITESGVQFLKEYEAIEHEGKDVNKVRTRGAVD